MPGAGGPPQGISDNAIKNTQLKVRGLSAPAPFPLCMEGQASAASSLATSFASPKAPYKSFPCNPCHAWQAPLLQGCFALSRWDAEGSAESSCWEGTLRVAPVPSAPRFRAAGPYTSDRTIVLQPLRPCRDGRRRQGLLSCPMRAGDRGGERGWGRMPRGIGALLAGSSHLGIPAGTASCSVPIQARQAWPRHPKEPGMGSLEGQLPRRLR